MDIENIAASAVDSSISKTEILSAYISRKDKEPSYDGYVYIHEDSSKSKKNLKTVRVQVKGKLVKRNTSVSTKYPISILDLQTFQRNGGAMYFVVYIDKDTGDALQIYYTALLPFKIMQLLKDTSNKNSLSVSLAKFPDDNTEKTAIFMEFCENAKLQASFTDQGLPTLEDLQKRGSIESLTIKYGGFRYSKEHPAIPRIVNGKEMFIYANVRGFPIPIPVEYHPTVSQITMGRELNCPVIVGDRMFYSTYQVLTQEDNVIFKIGNCLTVTSPNLDNPNATRQARITISANGTLNQRLVSYPFIDALVKEGCLRLGGYTIPIHLEVNKLEKIHYSEFETQISTLQRIRRVLDELHVIKDLNLDEFDERDYFWLNAIVGAVEEGATIYNIKGITGNVSTVKIANIRLAMLFDKKDDGGYKLRDFFGHHIDVAMCYEDEDPRTPRLVSQYVILKKDDFHIIDNIDYGAITSDIKSINSIDGFNESQANVLMYEMLNAYDESGNVVLLRSAEEINDWLLTVLEDTDRDVALLNKMQIILRRRQLSFAEKHEIILLLSRTEDKLMKAGAYIILGEMEEAKALLSSVNEDELTVFKMHPIYHFYKAQEAAHNGQAENAQPE